MSGQVLRSPLFWKCKCKGDHIHFTDDDVCTHCGKTEGNLPHADVRSIRKFFPFVPLKKIPQDTKQGIIFAGRKKVHPLSETGSCPAVTDAFFAIRELIRNNTMTVFGPSGKLPWKIKRRP
jgi:hypothetical protein